VSAAEGGCGRHVRMMSTEWHMCENGCAKRAGMGMSSMVCQRLRGEVTVRNGEEAEVEYLHMQREHRHNRPRSTGGLPPCPATWVPPLGPSPDLLRSTILTWCDTKITRPVIVERLNGSSVLATSISWCDCKVFIPRKVSIFMTNMGYFVVIQSPS